MFLKLLPLLFYFVWLSIGLLWTEDMVSGWKEIEYSLSFLIFPFAFGFSKLDPNKYISRIFSYFTYGVIVSIIICFIVATYNFIITGDLKHFYYADLSFFHHPTYMAMFGCASMIYLFMSILYPKKVRTYLFKSGLSKFAFISIISIFVLLLMSKAGILFSLTINTIGILAVFRSRKKLGQAALVIAGLFLILIGAYLTIEPLNARIDEAWESISTDGPTESSTGARMLAWEASWETIQANPILGVGSGDLSNELDNFYLENNYEKLYEKSLNSHNQFFETWGKNGFIGLLSILAMFFYAVSKGENKFYLLLVLLIWSNMMMESMLQTQSGIVFIAFINSMFATAVIRRTE